MTDYRDRRIKAILVPSDEEIQIGELEEKSIREWLEVANITWLSFVNASSTMNMSMMIDDDGLSRGLPWNPRAHFLCGYPTEHPIVGDAIMLSLAHTGEGMDAVDLVPEAAKWLKDPARAEEYKTWLAQPAAQGYFYSHRFAYPQRPPVYPQPDTAPTGTVDWTKPNLHPDPLKD
jgi:hypothetical protein